MTAPREDRVRLHPVWIGCYSATAWIPVGMWVALLLEAFAAPAQERLAYGLAGAYMTLIAGFIGALLQLARPTLDIDMAAIRHVLEFAAKAKWRNPREWAEEQMDRLPQ